MVFLRSVFCWLNRPRLNRNVSIQATSRSAELTTKPEPAQSFNLLTEIKKMAKFNLFLFARVYYLNIFSPIV